MKNAFGNVVLITGASSGIGKSLSGFLMKNGFRVYGTSRKIENTDREDHAGVQDSDGFIKMVRLDVCSKESVKDAVRYVLEKEGRIDILINNAGFGIAGSVEDTSEEEALRQFDTNFFGVHRVLRNVVPVMRRQKRGLIINISSVAGFISIPYQSMYSASKYALEAMTEVLRIETRQFGIKAVLIEPGDTKTGFTGSRQYAAASGEGSVYRDSFVKSINTMIRDEMNANEPDSVIKTVARLIGKKNPPVRVVVGFQYKVFGLLKRIVPSHLVEYIISRIY